MYDFIIKFDPVKYSSRNFKAKLNHIPEDLWWLKSIIRCYLKINERDLRYVFGSAKKKYPFMSRVLLNYDANTKNLNVICLINDEKVCNKVFNAVDKILKLYQYNLDSSSNKIQDKIEKIRKNCKDD